MFEFFWYAEKGQAEVTGPVLSVLDPSPIFDGQTAADAYADTLKLAQDAERLGYRSYWVQEHHNAPCFASVAPEVLIAAIGGVMLPNYSPLKVAEQFVTLEALYPGRIELGLGRATGADPRTSAALLGPGANEFPQMLRLLLDWLMDASGEQLIPQTHPASGIKANPSGRRPDVWMLSSSPGSAAFAGQMGLKLAFADFLTPGGAAPALQAYREAFQSSRFAKAPYCAIGLVALAAETDTEAQRLAQSATAWNIRRARGEFSLFPTISAAEEIIGNAEPVALEAVHGRAIVGNVDQVSDRLRAAAHEADADELFILTPAETYEARLKSYELLADAFNR